MPCRDPFGEEADRRENQQRLDAMTRMLCAVCAYVDSVGEMKALPDEVRLWWKEHQEFDRKRIAAEAEARWQERKRKMEEYLKLKKELEL